MRSRGLDIGCSFRATLDDIRVLIRATEAVGAPGRVELPTNGLGNRCSIHLSYGADARRLYYRTANYSLEISLIGRAHRLFTSPIRLLQFKFRNTEIG